MNRDECKCFTGIKLRESDKAILFKIQEIEEVVVAKEVTKWIPLSQIDAMETDPNRSTSDRIWVRNWLAAKFEEDCNG
jgi:protein involved in temperature-dependent protein secretion